MFTHKHRRVYLWVFSALIIRAATTSADPGREAAAFLLIPVGAGPAALGSAYSPLANDAYAPLWNPAGLGQLGSTQVSAQHLSYLESIHHESVSAVHPLRRKGRIFGGVGLSIQYLGSGDIDGYNADGDPEPAFNNYYAAYALSYGHALNDRWAVGATGKWVEGRLSNERANAMTGDLGLLYRPHERWRIGFTINQLAGQMRFLEQSDDLPRTMRLGVAWEPSRAWQVALQGTSVSHGSLSAQSGLQWSPLGMFSLRAGYRTDVAEGLSSSAGFSVGAGMKLWGQEIAYAWLPYAALGATHYASLVFRMMGEEEQRANMVRSGTLEKPAARPEEASEDLQMIELLESGRQKTVRPAAAPAQP